MPNLNYKNQDSLEYTKNELKEYKSIRKKIAQDFHDEMGSRLTRISLLAELILSKTKSKNGQTKDIEFIRLVKLINDNAILLDSGTREFIWAIDPKNNSLWEMAVRLKDFGDDLFEITAIDFQIEGLDESYKNVKLSMDLLRHITLIFKEGMTNVLKHAQAKKVYLGFALKEANVEIILKDDGIGFDPDLIEENSPVRGMGLFNLKSRINSLNGKFTIKRMDRGICFFILAPIIN